MVRSSFWGWNPWSELDRLTTELLGTDLPRALGGAALGSAGFGVRTTLDERGATLYAVLPGFEPGDIGIEVAGDRVSLSVERPEPAEAEGVVASRRERVYGKLRRTLRLPFEIDADGVHARYERGILELQLPRMPKEQPKRITVTAA